MKRYIPFLSIFLFALNATGANVGINMDEAKTIKSDEIEYDFKTQGIKASGNTEITNASGQTAKSDTIEYNTKTKEIKTSGNTEITNEVGQRAKMNNLKLSQGQDAIDADDVELWLGNNIYVRAKHVTRDGVITTASHAEFTACDGCDEYGHAWEIFSYKFISDTDEKMLYFHSASFWIYNDTFPILWLPYYEMPDPSVKYKTGFLNPSFNSTNGMGTQINVPFYINFSERHDLTTTFSYLTNENPLFQAEHRLNLRRSEFRTKGSFTRNTEHENRWHLFNNDKIELGEHARAFAYVARTSDRTYLQKYGFYDNQPYLDSGAKLELFGQTSYIVADTHTFQELREPSGNQQETSGNILPNIRATHQTNPFFRETYLSFSGDFLGISGTKSSSQRTIGEARIISPWTLWGGNRLTLSTAARYDIYKFDNLPVYENNAINND